MSALPLKQALLQDLNTLKALDVGIIPGRIYYRDLFLGWFLMFSLFLGIQFLACFYAVQTNAWEYVPNLKSELDFMREPGITHDHSWESFDDQWDLEKKFPNATPEEINQMVAKNEQRREAERLQKKKKHEAKVAAYLEDKHLTLLVKMFFGVIFSSLFFSLFLAGKFKLYVLFRHQLQPRLQTGDYLAQKIKLAFWGFFLVFTSLAFIAIPLFEQDVVFFSGIPCLIVAAFAVGFLINLEMSRLGASVLFTALSEYFARNKETAS